MATLLSKQCDRWVTTIQLIMNVKENKYCYIDRVVLCRTIIT